jgi:hypothetical protein
MTFARSNRDDRLFLALIYQDCLPLRRRKRPWQLRLPTDKPVIAEAPSPEPNSGRRPRRVLTKSTANRIVSSSDPISARNDALFRVMVGVCTVSVFRATTTPDAHKARQDRQGRIHTISWTSSPPDGVFVYRLAGTPSLRLRAWMPLSAGRRLWRL